jgi:hypothetical protein
VQISGGSIDQLRAEDRKRAYWLEPAQFIARRCNPL